MKVIKCTQLQDEYRGIKDDASYHNFTAFYNKMNENYRMLIAQKIIKPVSIFKSKINHMDSVNDGNNFGPGGCGRVLFGGIAHGGKSGVRGRGRGRQGGHDGCGIGGYNGNKGKHRHVYLSLLLNDIELNNITFDDKKWHN